MTALAYGTAGFLAFIGLYGIVTSRNFIHLIGCLTVVQSSGYVMLMALGYRTGAPPPIFLGMPVGTKTVDPVVQSLVLTDIVVSATVTALLLALAIQLRKREHREDPQHLRPFVE